MLEGISYKEEGSEKTVGIREKAKSVNLLLNDPELLEDERNKYKKVKSSKYSYQDKFAYNPESYYDSPKEYERKSEPREKPKKKRKHKKEAPKEEVKKPTSELFDLLDIAEDNKEEVLPNVFDSNPPPTQKPPNDLFDLLSIPESQLVVTCNDSITFNSATEHSESSG
jgi:hypothetical protein